MNARRQPMVGGFGRAAPRRRKLAFLALALLAFTLEGCAQFGTCNGCGPGFNLRQLGQRVFHRKPACDTCGEPGMIGGAAIPMEVAPPPVITSPPGVIPAEPATGGAPLPPPADEAPLDLSPIDENAAAPSSTRSQARRPSQSLQMAGRDGVSRAGAQGAASTAASDPLGRFNATLQPPIGDSDPGSPPDLVPKAGEAAANPVNTPAEEAPVASSVRSAPDAIEAPPQPLGAAASLAPGIASFESVEEKLAGGSLPDASGLSWLVDRGYRTVLDLRPPDQLRQEDIARINSTGLRYLALPITTDAVGDPETLDLFASLLNRDASRPLFFFDTDGSRAAVMWYLHKVVNLKAAPQDAIRQADALGPRDPNLWARATAYIDRLQPSSTTSAVPAPEPPDAPVPDRDAAPTSRPRAALNLDPNAEAVIRQAADVAQAHLAAAPPASAPVVPAPAPTPEDPTSWRPFAALAASGLTVPLFFLGRTAFSHAGRSKASRGAEARESKSLPDESGA